MELIGAVGLIVGCWVIGVTALVGWGLWVCRWGALRTVELSLARAMWVGLLAVIALLQAAHFFWPIDGAVSAALVIGGMTGVAGNFVAVRRRLRERRPTRGQAWVIFLLAIWLAEISLHGVRDFDTELYHLQAVKWIQAYPVVVGLGNLHGRLAFNSGAHLVFAALAAGPWKSHGLQVGNGFFLLLLVLSGARHLGPGAGGARSHMHALRRFWMMLIPLFGLWAYWLPGTYSTDIAPFMLLIAATDLALGGLLSAGEERRDGRLATAGLLAIGAIVMKLSSIAYVAAFVAVLLVRAGRGKRVVLLRVLACGAGVLLVPWVGRNIVMSGCLIYPVAFTRLPVSWAVPAVMVRWDAYAIHTWAMWGAWPPADASFVHWAKGLVRGFGYFYAQALLPAALALGLWWDARRRGRRSGLLPWLLIPGAAAVLFWLVTAPAFRFVSPIMWLSAAIVAGCCAPAGGGDRRTARRDRGLLIGMIACALVVGMGSEWELVHDDWRTLEPVRSLASKLFAMPGPDGGFPRLEMSAVTTVATRSGLLVHVPADGKPLVGAPARLQPYTHGQVGDAPLPASPYVDPLLRLRDPADMGRGFMIDRRE